MEDYKKKYEEALKRAKTIHNLAIETSHENTRIAVEELFPELKESEDEIIRKECISIIDAWDKSCKLQGDYCEVAPKCIAWLEKQGKKKLAWSEGDERIRYGICDTLDRTDEYIMEYNNQLTHQQAKDWLKSLKERMKGE